MLISLRSSLFLALLGVAAMLPAAAAGNDNDCKNSQDCALDAREHGKIRPLSDVLAAVHASVPGEVVKIELDHDDGAWIYEIKILTTSGRRLTVKIDAETLALIKIH